MKKIILAIALAAGIFLSTDINAQITATLNIGAQPIWGPTGYDYVDYYYFPDIDIYYSVPQQRFIYMDGGNWITATNLPNRCASYDLYNAHKVVMNEPTPYLHNESNQGKYASFKRQNDQHAIRDSHEEKYFENKDHPEHGKYAASHGNNSGIRGEENKH